MLYLLAMLLMLLVYCCFAVGNSTTISSGFKDLHEGNSTRTIYDQMVSVLKINENASNYTDAGGSNRFKRQLSSGAGKFTEAAQVPQLKLLRLFLMMFKNLWAKSYTGGSNPFHPYVPKPTVQLFKQRIVDFFFPDIGEETIKT